MLTFDDIRNAETAGRETLTLSAETFEHLCQWCRSYYRAEDAAMMAVAISDWLERQDYTDAEYAIERGWPHCADAMSAR